jgi:hypothetical protein
MMNQELLKIPDVFFFVGFVGLMCGVFLYIGKQNPFPYLEMFIVYIPLLHKHVSPVQHHIARNLIFRMDNIYLQNMLGLIVILSPFMMCKCVSLAALSTFKNPDFQITTTFIERKGEC